MAARKTSYLRKVPYYSQRFGNGEFGYGGKISSGVYSKYGRKRGEFESNFSYEIDNVVVNASPRKRRKFAPVNPVIFNRRRNICDDLGEKGSSRVPRFSKSRWVYDDDLGNKGISRAPRFSKSWWVYDDDFGEKGISRVPRFSKSRWVYNDGGLDECSWVEKDGVVIKAAEVKERRLSPRIGVIEKEGLDSECAMRVYSDDCIKVAVSDDKGCVTSESDLDYSDEGFEGGVSRVGREIMQPQGCRSVVEYEKLSKISEGSYGIVYEARDKRSGDIVALKKMKLGNGGEGFPMCYLREISILMSINHPSIVNVREVVVDDCINGFDSVYLVMDYLEHDIRKLVKARGQPFSQSAVKCLMLQLLEGVEYLHDNRVFHRDLKTANLLLNNKGELKICDFGLSCLCESLLKPCTSVVVTIWYRAPELLLGAREYSTAVDMWSVGCIMAELLTGQPLFNGNTEVEQIGKIFNLLGTPNDHIWQGYSKLPGVKANFVHQPYNLLHERFPRSSFIGSSSSLSDSGLDLLSRLLTYDPEKRITAKEALNHCWFQEVPPPCSKDYMPTFPAIL